MACIHMHAQQKHMIIIWHSAASSAKGGEKSVSLITNQGVTLYSCRGWPTDCLPLKEFSLIITKWQHGGKKTNKQTILHERRMSGPWNDETEQHAILYVFHTM